MRTSDTDCRGASIRAFTLIEMLVSLAITMMMMGAAVTLFQNISESVSGSRSIIEMSDRLRATRNRLQADLIGATATMTPPLRPESDEGYFEYVEGPDRDSDFSTGNITMFGDTDDVLMFTVRSRGEPFIGKWSGTLTMESQCAEVIYFCVANGPVVDVASGRQLCTLYRRVLLISPDKNLSGVGGTLPIFFDTNDLSVRFQKNPSGPNYSVFPNTLGDLTKRENRFSHWGTTFQTFPYFVFGSTTTQPKPTNWPAGTNLPDYTPTAPTNNVYLNPLVNTRLGDDVLLTNVLSFDVQVYDRLAPVFLFNGVAIEERDNFLNPATGQRNYTAQIKNRLDLTPLPNPPPQPDAYGCYVNLGYYPAYNTPQHNNQDLSQFSGNLTVKSGLSGSTTRIWDTWSLHYENDGLPQNGSTDTATNGLDDDGNGIVDDVNEFDTLPPYSAPLRGIRVTIRVYEPNSQQVRQVEVVQDFLPE